MAARYGHSPSRCFDRPLSTPSLTLLICTRVGATQPFAPWPPTRRGLQWSSLLSALSALDGPHGRGYRSGAGVPRCLWLARPLNSSDSSRPVPIYKWPRVGCQALNCYSRGAHVHLPYVSLVNIDPIVSVVLLNGVFNVVLPNCTP